MPKSTRGLPPTYSLKVPEHRGPVDLNDYLDEVARPSKTPPKSEIGIIEEAEQPDAPPELPSRYRNVVPMPDHADSFVEALQADSRPALSAREGGTPLPRSFPTAMRKQLNLKPDTLAMIDDLLDHLRRYSGQKDVKASEMFHALVLALHEARNRLDLNGIKPRGKWGSATARNFTTSLKDAFQDAIADWHKRRKV